MEILFMLILLIAKSTTCNLPRPYNSSTIVSILVDLLLKVAGLRRALQLAAEEVAPVEVHAGVRPPLMWVSFYNTDVNYKIRELKTSVMGQLCTISGTGSDCLPNNSHTNL